MNLIILGGGGHAKVVLDSVEASGHEVVGFLDQNLDLKHLFDVKQLGDADPFNFTLYSPSEVLLVNGFGSIGESMLRATQYKNWKKNGFKFLTVRHPSAIIAKDVTLDEGAQIMAGAVVQPGVKVGENTIINTCAAIDHDCTIGAHVHIATGASISGNVTVHDEAHIGTGATIIQGIQIGQGSVVGAGSVVVRNVIEHTRVMGVPAHHEVRQLDKDLS